MAERPIDGPLNLLSLDGGGIRGLSELIILHEIMWRLQCEANLAELPKPCEYFHLIGGSSTGGLIAIMLGRLQMSTEVALKHYLNIIRPIFDDKKRDQAGEIKPWDKVSKANLLGYNVQQMLKQIVGNIGGDRMLHETDSDYTGKVFVCAAPCANIRFPTLFRTYGVKSKESANCTIWEAVRATMAYPKLFADIEIPGIAGIKERFTGGDILSKNPTRLLLKEAKSIYPECKDGLLLSIGSGHCGAVKHFGTSEALTELQHIFEHIATFCENVADEMAEQYSGTNNVYFRFNVQHGLEREKAPLEEWFYDGEILTHTKAYLSDTEVSSKIDLVVQHLMKMNRNLNIYTNLEVESSSIMTLEPLLTKLDEFNEIMIMDQFVSIHHYAKMARDILHFASMIIESQFNDNKAFQSLLGTIESTYGGLGLIPGDDSKLLDRLKSQEHILKSLSQLTIHCVYFIYFSCKSSSNSKI